MGGVNIMQERVPEFYPSEPDVLQDLPEYYRDSLVDCYNEKLNEVHACSNVVELPMPSIEEVAERAQLLVRSYEIMESMGWEPEIVIETNSLRSEQWDALLSGHKVGITDASSQGIFRNWKDSSLLNQERLGNDTWWDVSVINATDKPAVRSNTKSMIQPMTQEEKKFISALLNVPVEEIPTGLTDILRPSFETYCSFQLGRLLKGKIPIDANHTCTIGKEKIEVNTSGLSQCLTWTNNEISSCATKTINEITGLRPTLRVRDLKYLSMLV